MKSPASSRFGLGAVALLIGAVSLVLALFASRFSGSEARFRENSGRMIPELHAYLDRLEMAENTTRQRAAYRDFIVIAAAGAVLGGFALRRRASFPAPVEGTLRGIGFLRRRLLLAVPAAGAILVAACPGIRSALLDSFRHDHALVVAAGGLLFFAACCALFGLGIVRQPWFRAACLGGMAVYAACAMLPGLGGAVSFASWTGHLSVLQEHAGMVLVDGIDRLRLDPHWLPEVAFPYGLIPPALFAGWERFSGSTLSWAEIVRTLQVVQIVFVVLLFRAYASWYARRPLGVVLAMALVLPWVHNNALWIIYPNHAGLRFLAFPAAFLALLAARRWEPRRAAAALGALAGIAFLWNGDTGVIVALGFLAFVWLGRGLSLSAAASLAGETALFVAGWAAGFAAGILAMEGLTGHGGLGASGADMAGYIIRFAQGFGGEKWDWVWFPCLVLLYAAYFAVKAGLVWARGGTPGFRRRFAASVAVMAVVWGAYFVSRPNSLNGWSLALFMGFLLSDSVSPRLWRFWLRRWRRGVLPWPILALALVVLPQIAFVSTHLADVWKAKLLTHRLFRPAPPLGDGEERAFGVVLSRAYADTVLRRIDYVKALRAKGTTFAFFSQDASLVRHYSGLPDGLIFNDPLIAALTRESSDRMVAAVLASAPDVVLFDDPALHDPRVDFYGDSHPAYFARLRESLSKAYELKGAEGGWLVMARRDAPARRD